MTPDAPAHQTPHRHEDGRSQLVAYDYGAQLASWQVDGQPVIWLSPNAILDGSAGIRGGVPICFPWFADGPDGDRSPSHGLARTTTWTPVPAQGQEVWAWELTDADVQDRSGAEHLPGPFRARYAVSLPGGQDGSPVLGVELAVDNPGPDAYQVEVALHTYLAVSDVEKVRVRGLADAAYLDKTTWTRHVQDEDELRIVGETDRVYDSVGKARQIGNQDGNQDGREGQDGLVLVDPGRARIHLHPVGATQTVVWNPGADKAAELADVGAEHWRGFVCVETAATADRALTIPPGGQVRIGCTYRLEPDAGGTP